MADSRRKRISGYVQRRRLHRPTPDTAAQPRGRTRRRETPLPPPGPRTINLISRDNGIGLTADMELLESILTPAGFDVARVDWTSAEMRPCQVAIFLELINPALFRYARATVGVLNLEWLEPRWRRLLPAFTQLWAKSREAHAVYTRLGLAGRAHLTGFASKDLHDPGVPRELRCLHLQGHSRQKNTEAVLHAWRRHPDLPPLTVITATPIPDPPPGVTVLPRIPQDTLVGLLNQATIHVCPSRTEGWGHYITEALSVGAVVVTTDASPMNEHVLPDWGVLVPPARSVPRRLVHEHGIDPDQLAAAVRRAAGLPEDERLAMGHSARAYLLARNDEFRRTAARLVEALCT